MMYAKFKNSILLTFHSTVKIHNFLTITKDKSQN